MSTAPHNNATLTHGGLLAKNVIYNLLGMLLPLVVAMMTIPRLVKGLGTERFGVLALSWVVLGYFGVFDFGLGRVITKMIGEKLGKHQGSDVASIAWTGLFFLGMLGLVMAALLYMIAPLLVFRILKISAVLQQESLSAFRVLSLSVIFVILTVGLRATQEAYQKFAILNVIRTLNGILIYLAPLLLLPFTRIISHYVWALTGVRLVIMLINGAACAVQFPTIRRRPIIDLQLAKPMFRLGGWMSISNLIGPIMVYFDRFLMGAWISVAAVAFYVTPYEVIIKLLVITSAVVQVLFPAFSVSTSTENQKTALLYSRGIRILNLAFFPVVLAVILFSRTGLALWLTPEFAEKSTGVAQWLAIGIFLNAPGQIAYSLLQAGGRPDLTAKVHVFETPVYLAALYFGVKYGGITGAAIAWTLRLLVETFVLFYLAEKMIPHAIEKQREYKLFTLAATILFAALTFFSLTMVQSVLLFIVILLAALVWFGLALVNPAEFKSIYAVIRGQRS